MSHEIPVFSFPVDESRIVPGMDCEQALHLAPVVPDQLWMTTSRNWWYQNLLAQVLQTYPGFDDMSYLVRHVSVVRTQDTLSRAQQIRKLLAEIQSNPIPFSQVSEMGDSLEEIPRQVQQAEIARSLDDDSVVACANFFSFLLSQAAALEEAHLGGQALLYVQPQPIPSPQRL